jgi:SAM-dependent methyltransferase
MNDHDQELAKAFDTQAPQFERAPVQSDPVALARLVRDADFPPGGSVLDAGCGPGLVSAALLQAGYRVLGVDLSREMIQRARTRCARFAETARFLQLSVFDPSLVHLGPFDGAISRFVLHHVLDPVSFVRQAVELLRPGGVVAICDHVTDTDPERSAHHDAIETARDRTHTRNLSGGQLVDLFASAGLSEIRFVEESFSLDFDEWFDRSTPSQPKDYVRDLLLSGPAIRSFRPTFKENGSIRIDCIRATLRGIKA